MPRLSCTYQQVIDILTSYGFQLHRQGATSHRIYRGEHSRKVWMVTVTFHRASDDVPTGTLKSMIRQSGLNQKLFRR